MVNEMSVIQGIRYICLSCSNEETIRCSKEDYKEVHVCSKCHGALVDIWLSGKYRKENTKKPSNALTVNVDANTDNLSAKLRVISKHAKALADELEEIDRSNA